MLVNLNKNLTNFQTSCEEVYFHVIVIFINLQKAFTPCKFSCRNNIAGNTNTRLIQLEKLFFKSLFNLFAT